MGAIDDIRERKAARERQQADLAKYEAIQKEMRERERLFKEQEAFDLGALSERRKQAPVVDNSGLYGAFVNGLSNGVAGIGDAVSSGKDAVVDFFARAVGPTPEEDARNSALGEEIRRSMEEAGVWSPANGTSALYSGSPENPDQEHYSRFDRIFNDRNKGIIPLTDAETDKAYGFMKSDKNFSDEEIRQLIKQKAY